ncbi:hypothetical protein HP439_01620 [Sphingobacterium shayense]|uniref:helix-turn-helix transcriptional regulator n=1 Tax=Sphingobacterium shayense TaxID=626343 RepID=UPI001557B100|nr:hypothetical protein [Sphingobacterium shayense]NQD69422.1 hypothetical protein [Sphingobacterium shayense]
MSNIQYFVCVAFILLSYTVNAQGNTLAALLDKAKSARMDANAEENYRLLHQAEQRADLENYPIERGKLFSELSKHYLVTDNFDRAKIYVDSNLTLSKASRNDLALAHAYTGAATYYNYLDIGNLAVEYAQRTTEVLKRSPDASLAARAYYILYGVYSGWDDLALTSKYAKLAIENSKLAKDFELLANSYSAYSTVMEYQYRKNKEGIYLDSIAHYLHLSLNVFETNPSAVSKRTYAISNVNLANYFFRYGDEKKPAIQDSILKYTNAAKEIYLIHDRSYLIMGNVNGLLAEVAKVRGNDQVAESYLMDSYIHLRASKAPSYYALANVTQGLSDFYSERNDFEKALFYQKKKQEFEQKIFDEAEMRQTKRLETQFENKQLQAQIQVAQDRESQRRIQIVLLIGLCLLLVIVVFLIRISSKNKHRLDRERNLRLQQQKDDNERQAKLQQQIQLEEQARLRSEQELLYIKQDQLQKEAMADALQIDRKNRLLLQLKEKFKQFETTENGRFIDRIIKEEMRLEEKVEQSARAFKDIHPDFFEKLKIQSGDKLSALELKHCAYMHLQLSTKEIAAAFHIEPKSVRVSKYRIKQKLQLPKETELNNYLQTLVNNS